MEGRAVRVLAGIATVLIDFEILRENLTLGILNLGFDADAVLFLDGLPCINRNHKKDLLLSIKMYSKESGLMIQYCCEEWLYHATAL